MLKQAWLAALAGDVLLAEDFVNEVLHESHSKMNEQDETNNQVFESFCVFHWICLLRNGPVGQEKTRHNCPQSMQTAGGYVARSSATRRIGSKFSVAHFELAAGLRIVQPRYGHEQIGAYIVPQPEPPDLPLPSAT